MPTTSTCDPPADFPGAAERLRQRGVLLRMHPGFYSVNVRGGDSATEYRMEDLAEAFNYGMTLEIVPSSSPLGPLGRGNTRRALMYRHNRKLWAKRALARRVEGATAKTSHAHDAVK